MSTTHSGNMLNSITFEEHDGTLNAKKVNIIGSTATIFAVVNTGAAGAGNVTLNPSPNFIGIVTIANPSSFTGNLTLDPGSRTGILGNLTLSDSKGFIGLVTVVQSSAARTITGNVTLSDSKGFIGLTTTVPAYGSNSTIFTQIVSATGNTTIFVAPASIRFFIKNLLVSSLGRSEVEIRSGATTLIPFTALATTGGYMGNFGEQGLPARAQADAFVVNLNGGATISVMANVRFES